MSFARSSSSIADIDFADPTSRSEHSSRFIDFELTVLQGVKFEPNSFKLNTEMVALMGGRDSQGYKMFTELTIKAFLAIRPHADQLCDACHLMLGTELPSFKGEATIRRLKERFQLQLGERAAADYMMGVIRNAHENMRSNFYDGFQKFQKWVQRVSPIR